MPRAEKGLSFGNYAYVAVPSDRSFAGSNHSARCRNPCTPSGRCASINGAQRIAPAARFPHAARPEKNPPAAKLWRLAMSRYRRHSPLNSVSITMCCTAQVGGRTAADTNNAIWSGKVLQTGGPFVEIWGNWTVPLVQPSNLQSTPGPPGPFSAPLPWKSSIWVGIDGWNTDTVFQAGTEQEVRVADPEFGTLGWNNYAWFEWFSDKSVNPEVQLMNFPVSPGDLDLWFTCHVSGVMITRHAQRSSKLPQSNWRCAHFGGFLETE